MTPRFAVCSAALVLVAGLLPAQTGVWTQRSPASQPGPRANAAMAYDAARGVVVLYGGNDRSPSSLGPLQETWEYDGTTWTQRLLPGSKPPARAHSMVYDSGRQRVVLVAEAPPMEVWEYDGTLWTLSGSAGLPARAGFALAYDSARGVVVLFGGTTGGPRLSDTWEWNGSIWTQRGTGGPPPRSVHAMAFDTMRQETVLFGGTGSSTQLGDTWEWDGSRWFEHFGVPGPAARTGPVMVYDSNRNRTVLYGGQGAGSTLRDTWEWDGSTWTQVQTSGTPPVGGAMGIDSVRNRVVLFLTHNPGGTYRAETWELSFTPRFPPSYTPFGAGCAGNLGVPTLAPATGQLPRIGQTFRLQLTNIPSTVFNLPFGILGFSNTQWGAFPLPLGLAAFGMPGCQAFVSVDLSETLVNLGGSADWDLAIPNDPAFLNYVFYVQGAVIDPGANAAGIVVSNAGHGLIGN